MSQELVKEGDHQLHRSLHVVDQTVGYVGLRLHFCRVAPCALGVGFSSLWSRLAGVAQSSSRDRGFLSPSATPPPGNDLFAQGP